MALPLRYNLLSLFARPVSTVSSVSLIAVIVAAFAYLQAVTDSAFNTLAATGDPNTVIVLNQSAESETVSGLGRDEINKLAMAPGAVADEQGVVLSAEMVAISSAFLKSDSSVAVNTAVRGVDFDDACRVRHGRLRMLAGRPFDPGKYEVIVGEAIPRLYRGHKIGDEIQMGTRGTRLFQVVGVFSTGGTAADSEIWGYVETMRDVYGRTGYSSARMLVANEQDARRLIEFVQGPEIGLTARAERDYFQTLNTNIAATQVLSVAMIIIMGIAAAFAVANTMYAAVAGRTREIGMLRALGFSPVTILTSFLLEGVILAGMGGILGTLLSLWCNGMQRSILPTTFTTVTYSLDITPKIVGTSLAVAVCIGIAGAIMPAWRAARLEVTRALREP